MDAAAFWGIAEELVGILSFTALVLIFAYVLVGKTPGRKEQSP